LVLRVVETLEAAPCPSLDDITYMQDELRRLLTSDMSDEARLIATSQLHREKLRDPVAAATAAAAAAAAVAVTAATASGAGSKEQELAVAAAAAAAAATAAAAAAAAANAAVGKRRPVIIDPLVSVTATKQGRVCGLDLRLFCCLVDSIFLGELADVAERRAVCRVRFLFGDVRNSRAAVLVSLPHWIHGARVCGRA
jgi:hypothetical protein